MEGADVSSILSRLRRVSGSRDDFMHSSPHTSPSFRTEQPRHVTPPQRQISEQIDLSRHKSPHGIKFNRLSSPSTPPVNRSMSPARDDVLKKYKDEVRAVKEHTKDVMMTVQDKITQMDNQIRNSGAEIQKLMKTVQILQIEKYDALDKIKQMEATLRNATKKVEDYRNNLEILQVTNEELADKMIDRGRYEALERDLRLSRDAETILRQENSILIQQQSDESKAERIAVELKRELTAKTNRVFEVEKLVLLQQQTLDSLYTEMKSDREKIKVLQDRNSIFVNENEELKRVLASVNEELANDRKIYETEQLEAIRIRQDLESLEAEFKARNDKLSQRGDEYSAVVEENEKLKITIKTITDELNAEKTKLECEKVETIRLRAAETELSKAVEVLKIESKNFGTKFTKAQHQNELLNDLIHKLTEEATARYEKEVAGLREEIKKVRDNDETIKLKEELYRNMEELLRVRDEKDKLEKDSLQLQRAREEIERIKEEEKRRSVEQEKTMRKEMEKMREDKETFMGEWLSKYDQSHQQSKLELSQLREDFERVKKENEKLESELKSAIKLKEELELVWDENAQLQQIEVQNTSLKDQHHLEISLLKEELETSRGQVQDLSQEKERLEHRDKTRIEQHGSEIERLMEELSRIKDLKQEWTNDQREKEIIKLREEIETVKEERERLASEISRHTQVNERLIVIQEQQMQFSVSLYCC
jgi:hypothetical protein